MAVNREDLHKIIDKIPGHKLPSVADLLKRIYEEDDEKVSEEEMKEIEEAEKRIANGEYITLDELIQDLGDENV
jgi:hypothetical protein